MKYSRSYFAIFLSFIALFPTISTASEFLKRTLSAAIERKDDISASSAHYRPLFGVGDVDFNNVEGIKRYGELTVEPGGYSNIVNYTKEEQIYFILKGTGFLHYDNEKIPVSENDFMYLPVGGDHGISNPREMPLRLLIMGFIIPPAKKIPPTQHLMLANADDVPLQVLGQHGPTTRFGLLMGTTESKRDRLAAAHQVNSLFLMEFAPGGTNIPHRHKKEEEIYFVLKGHGEMVAGEDSENNEMRYPAKEGDAFYFPPGILIGFYSDPKPGKERALILAVRSKLLIKQ